jgi:hypothetical protein
VVHELVSKSGFGVVRFLGVGFMDMHAKYGKVSYSLRYFNEVLVKSLVAWNAMIQVLLRMDVLWIC